MVSFRAIATAALLSLLSQVILLADDSPLLPDDHQLTTFLHEQCLDCHDGAGGEGGFDLHSLDLKAFSENSKAKQLHQWIRVFDRIDEGEMPPEEYGEIDPHAKERYLQTLFQSIDEVDSARQAALGRVRARRLTNDQLEKTLCDLLSIDVPLAKLMPDEQRTDGFRNIADAQAMSMYHLEDHLRVVDAGLDYAFDRLQDDDRPRVMDLPASRIANKRKGQRNRDPEMREGAAVVWSGGVTFYGRISRSEVRESGWYRITLDASSLKMPEGRGLWCSVRSGECVSRAPLMNWVGSFEATPERRTFVFEAWVEAGHMLEIRPADSTLKKARFRGGQVGFGEGEPQNVPGIAMHSLKIERVYPGGDRNAVRKSLFGDLDVRFDRKKRRFVWESDQPRKDLKAQVRRFCDAAFRAPAADETVHSYQQLVEEELESGKSPIEVLRQAYRAILCSPRFTYFTERPGRLGSHAIANRLSYMLTGTAPDHQLRQDADQGRLENPEKIVAHAKRLLQGDNLQGFVADFSDQWLDLADIAFTEPDRRMYGDFDLVVQNAMLQETRRFLETVIRENRPARSLVDADFTWLNNRLADYYDIDAEIDASGWRQVSLVDHPFRGGLMTHGSILKVTANGSNTSPVIRGVWICNRLLGVPIPEPPSNVPAIEPDVRGATTVRQILEKHRSQSECASCHAKIDPPGFALEHFDAAGKWRDHYLTRRNKSFRKGPAVDSAYQLADGRKFDSFGSFRELAASDDHRVARNFAAMLLVYSTGREITFADRKVLDTIVDQTKRDGFRLASLVEAVVTSETFLTK